MSSSRHTLPFVVYELTDACNQACRFCYNYWKGAECPAKPEAPNYPLARKTLRKLLSEATVGSLSLSGGEPMLMPHIHDLALKARFAGANVNLLTNGTLLGEEDVAIFNDIGLGAIQIPILSTDPALHDYTTNLKGSWQRAVEAALRVSHTKRDWLVPVLILSRLNAHQVEDILRFYHSEFGARRAMINRFNIGGLGLHNAAELNLSQSQIRELFATADRVAGELGMTLQSGVCTPLCVLNPQDYPHIRFSHCSTDLSQRPLTVNYRGDVRFCNHSPRVLGNIHQMPLREIVALSQSDGYFDKVPTRCEGCELWSRCRGGCRAASEQLYGSFDRVDPVLEQWG